MNFTGLFCVLLAQFLSGSGLLRLFKLTLTTLEAFCFSLLLGGVLISFVPPVTQLMNIPITGTNVAAGMAILSVMCSIPHFFLFSKPKFSGIPLPKIYQWPFIIFFLFLIVSSLWRCFYFPPTPRDVLAGGELIAEFTVREKTMLNSVYSIDLHTTNNQYKSPFLTSLQIIYKLFVCPLGSVWLSTLFLPFITFFYAMLAKRVHGFLACVLMLLYLAIPDFFAYSYMILYDYSNMIYFFSGFYFLTQHLIHKRTSDFAFAALLLGFATYIRVETLVLSGMLLLMPAFVYFREKMPWGKIALRSAAFMASSVFFYLLCMNIFVANIVPVAHDTAGQINQNLWDVSPFFTRIADINRELIFGDKGHLVYGYFMYFFMFVLAGDIILIRKFNLEARMALFGIAVVYFGLAFLSYLLPLFDLINSTKRGFFKIIPIMLMYMANSAMLLKVSAYLTRKEAGIALPPEPQTTVAGRNAPKGKK